jgi:hypothetical protein
LFSGISWVEWVACGVFGLLFALSFRNILVD